MLRKNVIYLFFMLSLALLAACGSPSTGNTSPTGNPSSGAPSTNPGNTKGSNVTSGAPANGNGDSSNTGSAANGQTPTGMATQLPHVSLTVTPTVAVRAFGTVIPSTPVSNPSAANATNAVHVTMTDNAINASSKAFNRNVPYTFFVMNSTHSPQDFIIDVSTPQTQTSTAALVIVPATLLTPGTTRAFIFSFPPQAASMKLEFSNHLAGPGGQGMRVPIQVH